MKVVSYRENLKRLNQSDQYTQYELTTEWDLKKYQLWYGEDIYINVTTNTLIYRMKVLNVSGIFFPDPTKENARTLFTTTDQPPPEVVYDRVGIIPYRDHYNLFHFLEGTNLLIDYLISKPLNPPVISLHEFDS